MYYLAASHIDFALTLNYANKKAALNHASGEKHHAFLTYMKEKFTFFELLIQTHSIYTTR